MSKGVAYQGNVGLKKVLSVIETTTLKIIKTDLSEIVVDMEYTYLLEIKDNPCYYASFDKFEDSVDTPYVPYVHETVTIIYQAGST